MSTEQDVKDVLLDMLGEEKKVKENTIPRNVDPSYKILCNRIYYYYSFQTNINIYDYDSSYIRSHFIFNYLWIINNETYSFKRKY